MGEIKVVLSGLFYPVAIIRYFQAALLRRKDVSLYTVGPYTGNSIPWATGMFVDCPLPKPDLVLAPGTNGVVEVKSLENLLPWEPDVWIQVDAAYHLKGRPTSVLCKHFVIGTDPHCVNYDYVRTTSDMFFNMQTPYMKDGDVWLPYAYDPIWHAPMANALLYDFGIVGADNRQGPLYNPRNELVKALRDKGYNVLQVFGKAYQEYRELLSQCKVGLNWSTRKDTTARVFETMGMSIALLTNRTPDLAKMGFDDGIDYMGFDDLGEALDKAEVLHHDSVWHTVSSNGRRKVTPETWDARVEQVLNHV